MFENCLCTYTSTHAHANTICIHLQEISNGEMNMVRPYSYLHMYVCVLAHCGRNQIKRMNEQELEKLYVICIALFLYTVFLWRKAKIMVFVKCACVCVHVYRCMENTLARACTNTDTDTDIHSKDSTENRQFNRNKHGRELWTVLWIYIHVRIERLPIEHLENVAIQ